MKTIHYRGWTTTLRLGKRYTAIEFSNYPKYNHRVLGINLLSVEQYVKHYIDEHSCRVQPETGNVIPEEPPPIWIEQMVSVPVPPEHFSDKSVRLHDELARLEAERDCLRAEGPVAPKGAWIEKYTAKRKRKKSASKVYIYYRLRNGTGAKHQNLGKVGSPRYNQAREAIARRNGLNWIEQQINLTLEQLGD